MLRKGTTGMLRLVVPVLLQQPVPVQQSCVQLQVLNLQAVRFRGKPSFQKHTNTMTRADKLAVLRQRAIDNATAAQASARPAPAAAGELQQQAGAAVAASSEASSTEASSSEASSSSSSSGSVTSTSDATGEPSSSSSAWAPSWLSDMFGRRRARPASKRSPLTPAASMTDAQGAAEMQQRAKAMQQQQQQQKQDDGWGFVENWGTSYSLDDYGSQIRNDPNASDFEAPPRPATPIRGFRALHVPNSFDQRRVMYYHTEQQYSVICALSPEDKLRIKLNLNIENDPASLQQIADRSSVDKTALLDLLRQYRKHQKQWKLLLEYRQSGNPMPPVQDYTRTLLLMKQLTEQHDRKAHEELLQGRDVAGCTLHQLRLPINKARAEAICPQTQLPYGECCGFNRGFKRKGSKKPRQLLSTL